MLLLVALVLVYLCLLQRAGAQYSGLASKAPPWYHNTPPWWLGSIPKSAIDPKKGGYAPGMVLASPIVPRKSAAPAYVGNPYGISSQQFENVAKNRLKFLGARAANDLTGSEVAATRTGDLGLVPASIITTPEHSKSEKSLANGGLLWTLVSGANDKERGGAVPNGAKDKAGAAVLEWLNPGTLGPSSVVVPKKLLFLEEHSQSRTKAARRRRRSSFLLRGGLGHNPRPNRADAEPTDTGVDVDVDASMGVDRGDGAGSAYTEDGGLASDQCMFQCLHTTAWGKAYEQSHPGGSSAGGSPHDNTVASKSTAPCGVQITEPKTDECGHCESRTCIAKAALKCKVSASTPTCNSRWLFADGGEFYDTTGLVPGSQSMRFSTSKKSAPPGTSFLETKTAMFPDPSGNSEDDRGKKILPLWDPYWETHMPSMMSSYAHNNRLLNYEGSALDYKYHPEHYGLGVDSESGSNKGEKSAQKRGNSLRRPRYTASDDRDW